MKEQHYGRIINTSSHNGLGQLSSSSYSAAKEGITGFSRSVARDMARYGVTCNVIRPIAAWRGAKIRVKEFDDNRPEDVAVLVTYLASASLPIISTAASLKSTTATWGFSRNLPRSRRSSGKMDNGLRRNWPPQCPRH